ncbi:hypothetical protein [Nocardia cyriacigeorgica]|uniref:hypothetical protein n=1 Tax=Nocardia cyriacigeorgica TaxID=135487 RepID=UPI00245378A3|nr:hypothetical protein [Nocardia cyriacigeorgica]
MRVTRDNVTETNASGHHPSAGNAASIASPATPATGIAAHSGKGAVSDARVRVSADVSTLSPEMMRSLF